MEQYIYLASLGIFLFTCIGWLVRISSHFFPRLEHSHWKRQQIRLHAGILALIVVSLCSYFCFYFFFRDRGPAHVFILVSLFSAIVIAQCGLAVYSLSDRRLITWRHVLAHYAVPVLFVVLYAFFICYPATRDTHADILEYLAWLYYSCYVVIIYFVSTRNSRIFRRRLEDSYVEIDQRQVMYRMRAIFYCVSILFLFIVFVLTPDYIVHSCYFLISTVGWSYFTSVILKMKDSPLANTMERQEKKKEPESAEEEEPTNADLLADSPVMQRLNDELEEVLNKSGLYLDPELDINMLAQALGTNRTYVGRLFRMRGTTFSRYVNSMRLNHAEELLRSTNKSVGAICEECGFSDATFRRLFADRYDCTPIEYRKAMM